MYNFTYFHLPERSDHTVKTKYWILLICTLVLACLGLSIPLLAPGNSAQTAAIISDGKTVRIVSLKTDAEFTVPSPTGGENTITVKDGKIGVTAATCPDHYCMDRGMCDGGAQIVCLPNRLIIRFADTQDIDGIAG